MLRAPFMLHNAFVILGCALLLVLPSAPASAEAINLSLNVLYANPSSAISGGTWELVAKSDGFGLVGVRALLTGIATAQNTAARGVVNGNDPAGMSIFTNGPNNLLGFNDIGIGQLPIASQLEPGEEESVFYGIGTLTNGSPNFPMKPLGTNSLGPFMTSLSGVSGVPWANTNTFNNPAWVTAAKLATGTFLPGSMPGFYSDATHMSSGNTFTSVGTSTVHGDISTGESIVATTIVRTNLIQTADYNHNGVVDAADYVVWRNTLNSTTVLDADGNTNGIIDAGDYTFWRARFGTVPGAGAGLGSATIPEPAAGVLLIIGTVLASLRRAARRGRRGDRELIRDPREPQTRSTRRPAP